MNDWIQTPYGWFNTKTHQVRDTAPTDVVKQAPARTRPQTIRKPQQSRKMNGLINGVMWSNGKRYTGAVNGHYYVNGLLQAEFRLAQRRTKLQQSLYNRYGQYKAKLQLIQQAESLLGEVVNQTLSPSHAVQAAVDAAKGNGTKALGGNNGLFGPGGSLNLNGESGAYSNLVFDLVAPTGFGLALRSGKLGYNFAKNLLDTNMGYWGDNLLTRTYGTLARRYGLPAVSRNPEVYRSLSMLPDITSDGKISLYPLNRTKYRSDVLGERNGGHANFTTDTKVYGHDTDYWKQDDVWIVDGNRIINPQTSQYFKSIEPSDTFVDGMPIQYMLFNPSLLTVVSGRPETIDFATRHGINIMTDKKLLQLYLNIGKADPVDGSAGLRFRINKGTDGLNEYELYQRKLMDKRGHPTISDYKHLEGDTGLSAGVTDISGKSKFLLDLDAAGNVPISEAANISLKWPNGMDVNPGAINKAKHYIRLAYYNGHVFYHPASPVEAIWKNTY